MFKSKKGLTIVELLAVIIIIAIIGAIASTVLFNILDAVEEELLLLKMNSLEESALLYIADEKLYISSDGSSVTVQELIDKGYVTETDTCTDSSGSEYECLVNNVTNNSMNEDVILINFNDYNYTATYVSADSLAG